MINYKPQKYKIILGNAREKFGKCFLWATCTRRNRSMSVSVEPQNFAAVHV